MSLASLHLADTFAGESFLKFGRRAEYLDSETTAGRPQLSLSGEGPQVDGVPAQGIRDDVLNLGRTPEAIVMPNKNAPYVAGLDVCEKGGKGWPLRWRLVATDVPRLLVHLGR